MARIATYSQDTSISADDLLVGSDAEDSNITKNYRVGDLKAAVCGYKEYVFSFTQTGTNNPVVTEMTNNTGLTFTFTRDSAGVYFLTPSSSFNVSDTWIQITGGKVGTPSVLNVKGLSTARADIINQATDTAAGNPVDEIDIAFVEVRIY